MLRCVALVRTDVSGEGITYIVFLRRELRSLVNANVVPGSTILVTQMMEAIRSYKTSVLTKATWHNIPTDGIQDKFNFLSLSLTIFSKFLLNNYKSTGISLTSCLKAVSVN
jgi:hypothetical protein